LFVGATQVSRREGEAAMSSSARACGVSALAGGGRP
jgi:hypothetical protein